MITLRATCVSIFVNGRLQPWSRDQVRKWRVLRAAYRYHAVMNLDTDTCYRAVQSRDARFDGRFFTAVRTTGIYCRPVCPAVTPRLRNVTFYECAAAAEKAGFRPCRRCRPETSPGTPAWLGTSATVSRALREINDGYLDGHSVADLAARLGLGPRHLLRLFADHLGTTPVAVAQTRRVHFARNLLAETDLPLTRIALAAGFGSVRRFNELMKITFGRTPGELRQSRARPATGTAALTCHLPYRPPYAWDHLLSYLQGRAIPGVESIGAGTYRRSIAFGGHQGRLAVSAVAGQDRLRLQVWLPTLDGAIDLVARVRRMFDCGADPQVIGAHLGTDPLLKPLVQRRPGLRLPCGWDPFETAVRAILGQQVSVAAATTISGRLVARCGTALGAPDGELTHVFPTPAALAAADLDGLGLTTRRAAAVRGFAAAVQAGQLDLNAPRGLDDFVARAVALPGIGPWTAQYVAMRACGEPDGFPAADLGLRQAAPGVTLPVRSEAWRPWRAYAALHLWASLGDQPARTGNTGESE
jgi:AraC family transcriptional regulator of adaptative response / DNA-3-methyladenine glycosylase II